MKNHRVPSSAETCPQKKTNISQIIKSESRCGCMDVFRNARRNLVVEMYRAAVEQKIHPLKQAPRRIHLDLATKVEVKKLVKPTS